MALKVAIVGLPNVGKSTLFNALTQTAAAQAANYPFCTIEPNVGIVEVPDPNGPWGARGLGEIPFLPLVPAIAAAIHDATGVWVDEFPFTPERVLRALGKI